MEVAEDDIVEKIFYTQQILQLIRVIEIAREDFIQFDSQNKSYVDTFLDIDSIVSKYKQLQNRNLLRSIDD